MLRMVIKGVRAFPLEKEPLTAGRVGLEIAFTFSEDWNDLVKIVVFEGATTIDVALIGDTCVVPHEVLAIAGPSLKVGVYGMRNENDELVRATPTLWASFGRIESGTYPSGASTTPPTADVVAQILNAAEDAVDTANEAKDIAEGVAEQAASGAFKGEKGDKGDPGEKGDPGAAATVTVGSTTTGEPGTNASVENVGTSAAAVLNFTIPRGAPGQNGAPGAPGQNGTDGEDGSQIWKTDVAPTVQSGITSWSVSDLDGRIGVEPQVGDLVFCSYYYYPVTRAQGGTVIVGAPVNIRGPQGEPGAGGTVDSAFSLTSENPVQNKVITAALSQEYDALEQLAQTVSDLSTDKADKTEIPSASSADPNGLGPDPDPGVSDDYSRADHVHAMPSASDVGAIPTPPNPSIGDFLCYTANGWDAVTVPSAAGVSF